MKSLMQVKNSFAAQVVESIGFEAGEFKTILVNSTRFLSTLIHEQKISVE
jgi:hypothetical protein